MNEMPTQRQSFKSEVTAGAASLAGRRDLTIAKDLILRGNALPPAPVRLLETRESDEVIAELTHFTAQNEDALYRRIKTGVDPADNGVNILRKASVFLERSGFHEEQHLRQIRGRIALAHSKQRPLILAMPLGGGKVPVLPKGGGLVLPDFSEFEEIQLLAGTVRALRSALKTNVHFLLVPDAPLHAIDLGFPPEHVLEHLRQLAGDLPRLGVRDREVVVADTLSLISIDWHDAVRDGVRLVRSAAETDLSALEQQRSQSLSLRFIKNPEMFGFNYAESVLFYNALIGQTTGVPEQVVSAANEFSAEAQRVTPWYTAINHHGIRGTRLVERAVAEHFGPEAILLRMSVHAKPGEPRPQLSIANHHAPAALLPMHSLGLRFEKAGTAAFGLTFDLTARLSGATRVHEAGSGRFLFWQLSSEAEPLAARQVCNNASDTLAKFGRAA